MISRTMWGYISSLYEQAVSLMKEPGTVPEAIEKLRLIVKIQPSFLETTYALGVRPLPYGGASGSHQRLGADIGGPSPKR